MSDPALSTERQVKKIEILTDTIQRCNSFKNTPENRRIAIPTGDGLLLVLYTNYIFHLKTVYLEISITMETMNLEKEEFLPKSLVQPYDNVSHNNVLFLMEMMKLFGLKYLF
ncbi:MAG: hypothetical protein OER82_05975 [Nitrosopumilus sp.]|nr:hypothetical protein [Nitrosopumilus sp.]